MSSVFQTLGSGSADALVKKVAENTKVGSSPSSIASEAAKSTYYFPILTSKMVEPSSAALLAESLGYAYMDFMRACFALHPAVVVSGDVDIAKYLKRFHQNAGIDSNGYILDVNWNAVLESAYQEAYAPFKLFPNDSVNLIVDPEFYSVNEAANNKASSNASTKSSSSSNTSTSSSTTPNTVPATPENGKKSYKDIAADVTMKWNNVSDVKRSNGLAPIISMVRIEFIIKGESQKVEVNLPIGVKTVIHSADPESYIDRIVGYVASNKGGTLTSFIRWTSGEVKSLGDMLFGTKEMKQNLTGNDNVSRWFKVIEERKRLNSMPLVGIAKRPFLPNMTMLISMNDADEVKRITGIDLIKDIKYTTKLMKDCMLLSFVVTDEASRIAYVLYDSHSEFDEVPFDTMKRQNDKEANDLKRLLRAVSTGK